MRRRERRHLPPPLFSVSLPSVHCPIPSHLSSSILLPMFGFMTTKVVIRHLERLLDARIRKRDALYR